MLLMEDRALLKAYRGGEPAALARVYEHFRPEVERLLRRGFSFNAGQARLRFVGYRDAFAVEDVLQETFLRAFGDSAREGYTGLRPFAPYLLGIARNLVIDDYRKRSRELAIFVPEAPEGYQESAPQAPPGANWSAWSGQESPERQVMRQQRAALVKEFLATLEPEHRALVQVHFVERRSQEETAQALGVDRNRVRRLVQELRLKMLRFMKRRGQIKALDPRELITQLALAPVPPWR